MKQMKKLSLKKQTLANLSHDQITQPDHIKAGTLYLNTCFCQGTTSCTLYIKCCPPEEKLAGEATL